jgi:hypothetical protein
MLMTWPDTAARSCGAVENEYCVFVTPIAFPRLLLVMHS